MSAINWTFTRKQIIGIKSGITRGWADSALAEFWNVPLSAVKAIREGRLYAWLKI